MMEEWRPVPGYPHYEVSNAGNVRSIDREDVVNFRRGRCVRRYRGRMLSPIKAGGYLAVMLGGHNPYHIHRVVCWAFIGQQGDFWVNHKNGNKRDNRIENLEYLTPRDNALHAFATGLHDTRGEANGQAKITADAVREIRLSRLPCKELANQYGISPSQVTRIIKRKKWASVT